MTIVKIRRALTDGSFVFDVRLLKDRGEITFPAVTEEDADALIGDLTDAITSFTNEVVQTSFFISENA